MSEKLFRTRTGRNREQTIKAYCLFLTILRQKHEQGQEVTNLKPLAEQIHISSSISRNDLPDDLYTAPYEVVTSLDYAKSWFYSYLQPLRKERRIACKKTDIAPEGLFAEEAQTIEPPLTKIIAEIKTLTDNFIADVEAEMAKLRELYPIY